MWINPGAPVWKRWSCWPEWWNKQTSISGRRWRIFLTSSVWYVYNGGVSPSLHLKQMHINNSSNKIWTCLFFSKVMLKIYESNVFCSQLVKGWCETRRGQRTPSTCMTGMTPWSRAWCETSVTTRWCGSEKIRSPGDGRSLPLVRAESLWTLGYRSCTMKVCIVTHCCCCSSKAQLPLVRKRKLGYWMYCHRVWIRAKCSLPHYKPMCWKMSLWIFE